MSEALNGLEIQSREPEDNVPFTVALMLEGRCKIAFNYREVWANARWKIVDDKSMCRGNLERSYPVIRETRLRWLGESLGTNHSDNHQTYLVEFCRQLYFVTFSDGYIWIGDTARGSDY